MDRSDAEYTPAQRADAWEGRGRYIDAGGTHLFTVDIPPGDEETAEPLLILHGFPTSSFDFHLVADKLASNRRVLLLDMLGYGLSDKPDRAYRIEDQADIVQAFVTKALRPAASSSSGDGVDGSPHRFAILSHDMGDTVAGELLARQSEGRWDIEITRRVVTNGSIYIEMARLTDGQQLLLSLPDERLATSFDPSGEAMVSALEATLGSPSAVPREELVAEWDFIARRGGDLLLPRLVRYIEDRRRNEARYTGAIETHPSSLSIVWGTEDPIAVAAMANRLHGARPDSSLTFLDGVGHYPMLEAPRRFLDAVEEGLCGAA